MSEMGLVVVGAAGRMGRTLVRVIAETEGATLVGATEAAGSAEIGQDSGLLAGIGENGIGVTDDPLQVFAKSDGVLDFTTPTATVATAELAAQARIVHVVGTTGLSADDDAKLAAAARHAVIVKSGNMSLGVNLLAVLVRQAAKALDADFDIEILEMHHRHKVDAPSGPRSCSGRQQRPAVGSNSTNTRYAPAMVIPARATAVTSASRRCEADQWSANTAFFSVAKVRRWSLATGRPIGRFLPAARSKPRCGATARNQGFTRWPMSSAWPRID